MCIRDSINIHPFDCKITCAGEADAAILAGRLVKAGADINLIMHDLKDLRNTTDVRFMVDNLNHLKRTGRLSNAASFVGSILKIKPILSMDCLLYTSKPNGAKPGFVIYTGQNSIEVTPDEHDVLSKKI